MESRTDRNSVWSDLALFPVMLAIAWWRDWQTSDLIWSLWLSSLVVGYAVLIASSYWTYRNIFITVFTLGFFAVHFGGFHAVHSVFLNLFFPILSTPNQLPTWDLYAEVVRRYWFFLPIALLAERAAFAPPRDRAELNMLAPYKNVVRMHLLIFVLAGLYWLKVNQFAAYVIVYSVYFFPWRALWALAVPRTGPLSQRAPDA